MLGYNQSFHFLYYGIAQVATRMPLSLTTLNGRFTWVVLTFLFFLISLTLYSHHSVQQSANHSLEYIRKNQLLTEKLYALTSLLEVIESRLNQYSTFLRSDLHDEIPHLVDDLVNQTEALQADPDLRVTKTLSDTGAQLVSQADKLRDIIKQYLEIMQNVESRYPGMPILLTYLEPTNRKFSEAVEQALQEGELTEFNPKVIQRDQYRIMKLFQEARYSWAMQISWFRVFVANRMGAFGDPVITMHNNLTNRSLFASNVAQTLQQLDRYAQLGKLGLQQEESLAQMHAALIHYNKHLDQAVKIYSSHNWRADIALLRDTMQPALGQFWQTLHKMENAVADINKISISKSQATANRLSHFIWLFTGIISLMLLIAYNIFQKNIRKPVLRLADNMQLADRIEGELPQTKSSLVEINRLIDAYSEMRRQVDNRQRRLQSILDNAAESIITLDSDGRMESFNKAASQLFQYQPEQVIGKQFSMLFAEDMAPAILNSSEPRNHDTNEKNNNELEVVGKRKDGSQFYLSLKFSEMQIDGQTLFTAIVDDISERRAVMEHLRHLAEHDSLTGLYNRQYFNDEMERAFAQARRYPDSPCACIYIDLDNFKYINDTMGHLEGDRLLIDIANTLLTRTRKTDVLARLGGDEFALLLHNVDKQQATVVAENFRQAIASYSFSVAGRPIDTGCSVGVALYEVDIDNKEGLLARADIACHMAKRNGRNRVHVFENEDKNNIDTFYEEMGWARRIRNALEHDDFIFVCQPMLKLNDESIYSHELLVRMRDPDTNQYLLPSSFLNSAERFGLMPEIDRWVIEHAFSWLNEQSKLGQNSLCYFINLSGKSVGDENLLCYIKHLLPNLAIAPQRIVFEITENVAIAELDQAKHFLHELHQLGFRTALDDFGVGYSSFSYLRDLDVDFVKIDGSFINSMHTDELNLALVKAINNICHILGKQTVAEFVENDFALKLLKEIGVDYAQGHNIAATDDDQPTIQFRRV
jgi:diguanylate cyclase (GGDEF)-like protein/PAS domain S-box-containing protein